MVNIPQIVYAGSKYLYGGRHRMRDLYFVTPLLADCAIISLKNGPGPGSQVENVLCPPGRRVTGPGLGARTQHYREGKM